MGRLVLVCVLAALALAATSFAQSSSDTGPAHHSSRPKISSLSYSVAGDPNTQIDPQATYKATIRLYAHAASVALVIKGNGGAINRSVVFPKSHSAGLLHLSVKSDALPAGTFKVTPSVNLGHGRSLRGSNSVTLVVDAAGRGTASKPHA